jgi:hypothetical protein
MRNEDSKFLFSVSIFYRDTDNKDQFTQMHV